MKSKSTNKIIPISGYDYVVVHLWRDGEECGIDNISLYSFDNRNDAISYIKQELKSILKCNGITEKKRIETEIKSAFHKGEGRNDHWTYGDNENWDYWEVREIPHRIDSTWENPDYTYEYRKTK